MKINTKVIVGLVAAAFASVAMAVDYGWNPSTGLEAFHGALISQGTPVVISGCATISAQVGGASAGKFQSTSAACAPTFTFPSAAPNGWTCVVQDQVTVATKINQTSFTTTTAVFTNSAATTSGDTYVFVCMGF
jgi:hypothetical protein